GRLDQVRDPLEVQVRRGGVPAVRVADRGGEAVDAGARDEVDGDVERLPLGRLVRADAVLDALDALDLTLDVRAVPAGLGDHLHRLPQVLGDVELVRVEQHRVPAAVETAGDHRPIRTVVQVQR